MPIRPSSAGKKGGGKKSDPSSGKKGKKNPPTDDELIDPHQEQIDGLIREREEMRSKLNSICSKIIENINLDDYQDNVDLANQQPCDVSLNNILLMVNQICHYRLGFLNLFQETDDGEKISVQKKITQLSIDEPNLFRKRLTANQRLTFVARERDLWKENAELLQIMYGTIVDQLEMRMYEKQNVKTTDILRTHRLNLEDVCLIFSSPSIRSLNDAKKIRAKKILNELEDHRGDDNHNNLNISSSLTPSNQNENKEHDSQSAPLVKRGVSFADEVKVITIDEEIDHQQLTRKRKITLPEKITNKNSTLQQNNHSSKSRLPLASDTLVDRMDSNLRMLIIKELSKNDYIQKPSSKMSSIYNDTDTGDSDSHQQHRLRNHPPEWVELAQLIGIDESEIDHWLSQSLQYPAGRVISTWCNCTSPAPTVAELHSLVSSNELNRLDLARSIETMYTI